MAERLAEMEVTTPADLAGKCGVSERRIRAMARRLGACRVFGKTMVLLPQDVEQLLEAFKAPGSPARQIIKEQAARLAELEAREHARTRKMLDALNAPGFVYFIHCRGLVKIGFARNVAKRLKMLQTGSPFKLELLAVQPGYPPDELSLHKQFDAFRASGEWFRLVPELQAYIDGVKNAPR